MNTCFLYRPYDLYHAQVLINLLGDLLQHCCPFEWVQHHLTAHCTDLYVCIQTCILYILYLFIYKFCIWNKYRPKHINFRYVLVQNHSHPLNNPVEGLGSIIYIYLPIQEAWAYTIVIFTTFKHKYIRVHYSDRACGHSIILFIL